MAAGTPSDLPRDTVPPAPSLGQAWCRSNLPWGLRGPRGAYGAKCTDLWPQRQVARLGAFHDVFPFL